MPDLGGPQGRPVRGKGAGADITSIIDTKPATGIKDVDAAERARQALEMRAAGATYAQIAERLGWASASGAHSAIVKILEDMPIDGVKNLRQMQIERLQTLLRAAWNPAVNPGAKRKDTGEIQSPGTHLGYLREVRGILNDMRDLMGLDLDSGMADEAKDSGVVVIGGTKEQYMAALEAMKAAKEAGDLLEDALANEPAIDANSVPVWEPAPPTANGDH